mmetsp:Transcript_2550/g.4462  ORF Transcript_2550/g.4462 Transcript_2550/m.4462 type:complete len:138 (+) Transcript_2550:3-416(+)
MLPALKQGQEKMSKSDPESAIFMEDSESEVSTKIRKAYCPPGEITGNPCLEYIRHLVLPKLGSLTVTRSEENGGNKVYTAMEDIEKDFSDGSLHPGDLKPGLAKSINEMLQPVRDHFATNIDAKKLFEQVKKYRVTK